MRAPPSRELHIAGADFERLRALIELHSGIWASSDALLVQRLTERVRALGLDSFDRYYAAVTASEAERRRMLECLCTHETRFFREPRQLAYLEDTICPMWHREAETALRPRTLRIWSAGCATGEEPFSLAMVIRARLPDFRTEIVATDLSERVLGELRTATWPIAKAGDIPERYLARFMLRGTGSLRGHMRAAPELVPLVRPMRLNLCDAHYPFDGAFDAIFCRNVLIYFREARRQRVIEQLVRHLAPGGFLFLGHAEGLGAHPHALRAVGPIVYQRLP